MPSVDAIAALERRLGFENHSTAAMLWIEVRSTDRSNDANARLVCQFANYDDLRISAPCRPVKSAR